MCWVLRICVLLRILRMLRIASDCLPACLSVCLLSQSDETA